MIAHYRIDTRNRATGTRPSLPIEIEARTSALASMCLADDDLAGIQLRPGTPTSPPQDWMTLSLYASFPGFQAQHAESGYDEAIISALRETLYDQPMEEEEVIIPSPSPVVPAPTLAVGTDNETSDPKTFPPPRRQTRSKYRFASFVIPGILEPPTENDSKQEGSLRVTGPIVAKDRAASSLAKGPASKGPPKTADRRSGQQSVTVCGHTSVHVSGVAGNPRIQ